MGGVSVLPTNIWTKVKKLIYMYFQTGHMVFITVYINFSSCKQFVDVIMDILNLVCIEYKASKM